MEQALIQAGLAFFYTLAGIGLSGYLTPGIQVSSLLFGAGISAGLAFFTKLSVGTGQATVPVAQTPPAKP